jgi:hypothetical protein
MFPPISNQQGNPYDSLFHTIRSLDVEISGQFDPAANRLVAGRTEFDEPPTLVPDSPYGARQCGSAER